MMYLDAKWVHSLLFEIQFFYTVKYGAGRDQWGFQSTIKCREHFLYSHATRNNKRFKIEIFAVVLERPLHLKWYLDYNKF